MSDTQKPKTVMPDAAIDAMDEVANDVFFGRIAGRQDYMTAFEKIVAAGARTETPEVEALVKAAIAMNDAYCALLLMKAEDPTRFTGAGSPYRNLENALLPFKGA